jgi:hypothetical protein
MFNVFGASGRVSGGAITDGGSQEINVAAGEGLIRDADNHSAPLYWISWPALNGSAILDNTSKYVGVEYNAGVPQIVLKDTDVWNGHTEFPLGSVVREGTALHILDSPQFVSNAVTHVIERFYETERFERDNLTGGLIISEDGANRYITMSAGNVWTRLNRLEVGAVDTDPGGAADTAHIYIRDGSGGWVKDHATFSAPVASWPNLYYDNDSGTPEPMQNNRYANLWVYLELDDNDLVILVGQAEHTSVGAADAEALPATIPANLQENAIFLGRIIFQKSASAAEDIQTAFNGHTFSTSSVSNHENLSGLLGGAAADHYHLTSAEHAVVITLNPPDKQHLGIDPLVDTAESDEFEVSSSPAIASLDRAVAIPYQTNDGAWRLRGNVTWDVASGPRATATLTISGVTFKTGYARQAASGGTNNAALGVTGVYATSGGSAITVQHVSGTTTLYFLAFDLELDSKPTWAD